MRFPSVGDKILWVSWVWVTTGNMLRMKPQNRGQVIQNYHCYKTRAYIRRKTPKSLISEWGLQTRLRKINTNSLKSARLPLPWFPETHHRVWSVIGKYIQHTNIFQSSGNNLIVNILNTPNNTFLGLSSCVSLRQSCLRGTILDQRVIPPEL